MTVHSPLRFGRRTFVGSGLAWVLSSIPAGAQKAGSESGGPPSAGGGAAAPSSAKRFDAGKLNELISLALAEPDQTPLSRPAILGLGSEPLTTKSIERTPPGEKYGFMVIIPRREDALVFFRGQDKTKDKPLFFAIHRTGSSLKRVASAFNRDGKLEVWAGADADRDFAKQLAFWAK
jgi:hypothetical protein